MGGDPGHTADKLVPDKKILDTRGLIYGDRVIISQMKAFLFSDYLSHDI